MLSNSFTTQALAFLSAVLTPNLARGSFFIMDSSTLVIDSLDPLINPGGQSAHVHSVSGGSAFAPSMDFGLTQTSKCTTFPIIDDKSNYWMPAVYFHKNGKFTRLRESVFKHKIYYKYGTNANTPDPERTEFPQGFRMMSGDSNLRSDDGSLGSGGSQLNWMCHGGGQKATGFPKGFTNCNGYLGGLAASMRFPSCWNGQDFNKDAPLAHMAFPINRDGMAGCPEGFKKARFPEIFVEYWLDTKPFDGQYGADEVPWVIANGDPTGFSFHMDFLNGWKPGVLAKAIRGCDNGNKYTSLDSPQCFGPGSMQSDSAKAACTIAPVVQQDIGNNGPLNALPGCNPIQPGPGRATQANCGGGGGGRADLLSPASSVAAPVASSVSRSSASIVTTAGSIQSSSTSNPKPTVTGSTSTGGSPSGLQPASVNSTSGVWKAAGCFLDAINPRSLGKQSEWWGSQISSSNCVERCDSLGAKYAGTENGGQCFCGNQVINSANRPGKCTIRCNGDAEEICGGSGHLSIYSLDGSVSLQKRAAHHRHNRHS
ncbi:MAG: hypothetical protein Q9177_002754 [Variospora cf. flavescens]